MSKIEDALWEDYNRLGEFIKVIDEKDERKKSLLEQRNDIRTQLIKLEQSKNESLIKRAEIRAENEREKTRNRINIIMFSISTSLSLFAIVKTFKFDQEGTITSTLGRNILNGVIPKMFKR